MQNPTDPTPIKTNIPQHTKHSRDEEARRQAAITQMEEAALAAEGKYGSLKEEAAAKTRKLAKLQRRIAVGRGLLVVRWWCVEGLGLGLGLAGWDGRAQVPTQPPASTQDRHASPKTPTDTTQHNQTLNSSNPRLTKPKPKPKPTRSWTTT